MNARSLKERLKAGDLVLGSWLTLAHPGIAEILARSGLDWVAIDLEHSVINIREAEELIRVIDLCGVAPLVRLTSNDADQIKRVMDAGSQGVIVPMVNSVADAKRAVESVYYPGRGKRGVGLARAQGYGARVQDYHRWLESNATVIVQIEHKDAVRDVEAILSVPGVDGYILGPYDLSASLGKPGQFEDPEVVQAIQRVREVATRLKVPGGLHIIEPDPAELKRRVGEGFRFLAYSLDIRMLDTTCRAGARVIESFRGSR